MIIISYNSRIQSASRVFCGVGVAVGVVAARVRGACCPRLEIREVSSYCMMRIVIHEVMHTRASGTENTVRYVLLTLCGMMKAIVCYHMM